MTTLKILDQHREEMRSGVLYQIVADIYDESGKKIGDIQNYLQIGYKAAEYPVGTGQLTTASYYPTIQEAYQAGLVECNFQNI